jgi:hypothetical protein
MIWKHKFISYVWCGQQQNILFLDVLTVLKGLLGSVDGVFENVARQNMRRIKNDDLITTNVLTRSNRQEVVSNNSVMRSVPRLTRTADILLGHCPRLAHQTPTQYQTKLSTHL